MYVLTCAYCGEPIDRAGGVWFHPQRRFRGHGGSLPTLCDFGDRLGPTHAAPVALTSTDREFLHSARVSVDEQSFLLEALWLAWQHANLHRGTSACADCGVAPGGQHSLDCTARAPMRFDGNVLHQKCSTRRS